MVPNSRRSSEFLGGFKGPVAVYGIAQLCWLCPGVARGTPGSPTMSVLVRRLDLLLIEPLRKHVPDNIYGLVAHIQQNGDSMVDLV